MSILKKATVSLLLATALFANSSNQSVNWQNLLKEKKFEKIDSLLQNLESDILKNPINEKKLTKALNGLLLDSNLRKNIQEYAKVKPNSPFSHLLLGEMYYYKAFEARGFKWASETSKENFEKMENILAKADKELLKSLKLNDKIPNSYSSLISVYALRGMHKQEDNIYKIGLKKLPNSYRIRSNYMRFSLVKWGGTFEKIDSLLKDARTRYKDNPRLKQLEGYVYYAKADFYALQRKNYEKGLEFINKALEFSDNLNYYYLRGIIYKRLENYNKALKDFNLLLKDNPLDIATLEWRQSVYMSLKKYDLALKDAKTILKYRKSSYSYYIRGYNYYTNKQYNLAKLDLFNAIELDNKSAGAKKLLAFCYYANKEYSEAADYLQEAIEDGSNDSQVYYYLSASLWYNRDCKFVKSAYKYKESCTQNGDCNQEWLDWAVKSADYAKAKGICKG